MDTNGETGAVLPSHHRVDRNQRGARRRGGTDVLRILQLVQEVSCAEFKARGRA